MLGQFKQMVCPCSESPFKTFATPFQLLYAASRVGKQPTGKLNHVAP
jgi:hypothetical protein